MELPVVEVTELSHRYGEREALKGVSFTARRGELFALVGPNGGGKSTTFHILSTLIACTPGRALIEGCDVGDEPGKVRPYLGVVFQFPALDKKLSVEENLLCQAALYGIAGREARLRVDELLHVLSLSDRRRDRVETLSGGLKRRAEVARALIHKPTVLLLDEPTTGLDPLVRREIWKYLEKLRLSERLTILTTTHLLEEAESCDQVVFLDSGRVIASGTPAILKSSLGGDIISVRGENPQHLSEEIQKKFGVNTKLMQDEVRIERSLGHEFIPQLVEAFPKKIDSVTLGRPTLEDLFIRLTGKRLADTEGRAT